MQGRYITLGRAKVINSILIDKRASNLLLPSGSHSRPPTTHHDMASGSFIRPIINVGCGVIGLIHDQCRGSFSFGISVGTAFDSQDQDRQWAGGGSSSLQRIEAEEVVRSVGYGRSMRNI